MAINPHSGAIPAREKSRFQNDLYGRSNYDGPERAITEVYMNNTIENITLSHAHDFGFLCTDYYANDFTEGAIHCRGGINVKNTLGEGNDHHGGYLVPDIMEKYIIQALEGQNVMRRLATVIHTDGADSSIPVVTHVPEAQWLAEGEAINIVDTTFDTRTLKQHKLGVMVQVTEALAKDAGVDIREFLARLFAQSIAGAEEQAFIAGDGVKCPTGILAEGGAQTALTIQNAEALKADDLVALYYSLDEAYRKRAVFLMHEDTAKALALLKDDQGRYLCGDCLCNTVPETLFGCPVHTSRFMPKLGAGAKAIAFGDLSFYWIADRGNRSLRRLTELFARQSKIGFRMTERVDGRLMIPEAVKVLQIAE